ncbi:DUF2244 domain-containing protein [Halodurantibacterium flavum]|uniref:DUF2244 domain-containing protein n=1 Tax=Halodurantibacterium flavum TaxID=1382802 RepID=A0ABW4S5B9_9RHOB
MPVEWVLKSERAPDRSGALSRDTGDSAGRTTGESPICRLHLWPYRSLPKRGFALFFAMMAGLAALPLLMLLGSPVLWGILPFLVVTLSALWLSIQRSYRDGEVLEELTLWPDRIEIVRHNPRGHPQGRRQEWSANPHWVSLHLDRDKGPVPEYLTLRGAGREVELGAFLTPSERLALHDDLQRALVRV